VRPDGVTTTLFLPTSGIRSRNDALLTYAGNNGLYWSGSVSGVNAFYLYFNSGGINPADVNSRGYGFALRCIKN